MGYYKGNIQEQLGVIEFRLMMNTQSITSNEQCKSMCTFLEDNKQYISEEENKRLKTLVFNYLNND